jgi:hypothetical protein
MEHALTAKMDRFKTIKEPAVTHQLLAVTIRLMETPTTATDVPIAKTDRFQTNSKTNVSIKVNHPDQIAVVLLSLGLTTNANNAKMDRLLIHNQLNVLTDPYAIITNIMFKTAVSNVKNAHSAKL